MSHRTKGRPVVQDTRSMLDILLCLHVAGCPLETGNLCRMQPSGVPVDVTLARLQILAQDKKVHCHVDATTGRTLWSCDVLDWQWIPADLTALHDHLETHCDARAHRQHRHPGGRGDEQGVRNAQVRRDPLVAAFFGDVTPRSGEIR